VTHIILHFIAGFLIGAGCFLVVLRRGVQSANKEIAFKQKGLEEMAECLIEARRIMEDMQRQLKHERAIKN